MDKLQIKTAQTISSREVAKMMEVRHDNLIAKIERHTAILEKVTEQNFSLSDLWQLSSYKDSTGRTLKEYQVTKKGCEFLAHKTTGEKGDLLTIRYMTRFQEMEGHIKIINQPFYIIEDAIKRYKKWIEKQKEKQQLKKKKKEESIVLNDEIQELIEAGRLTLMEYDKNKYNRRRKTNFKWEKF